MNARWKLKPKSAVGLVIALAFGLRQSPAALIAPVLMPAWIALFTPLSSRAAQATSKYSNVATDQEIILFPTIGYHPSVGKGWEVEIHGCVYEEEKHRIAIALLRQALHFENVNLTPAENALFVKRTRLFMVDHERGKKVVVKADGKTVTLNKSLPDGQFFGTTHLPESAVTNIGVGTLMLTTLLRTNDARVFWAEVSLVGETGVTVISDIDDTIKITQVRNRAAALRNTFLEPFKAVPGMAEVYQKWRQETNAVFFYVSASPWQLFLPLSDFILSAKFPEGPFFLKDFRWKDRTFFNLFENPEKYKPKMIEPLLKRFPNRQFILVGDSGESDPEIYGALARRFPVQISRIFIREVTNDPNRNDRYNAAFFGVPKKVWYIFQNASEIKDALAR